MSARGARKSRARRSRAASIAQCTSSWRAGLRRSRSASDEERISCSKDSTSILMMSGCQVDCFQKIDQASSSSTSISLAILGFGEGSYNWVLTGILTRPVEAATAMGAICQSVVLVRFSSDARRSSGSHCGSGSIERICAGPERERANSADMKPVWAPISTNDRRCFASSRKSNASRELSLTSTP